MPIIGSFGNRDPAKLTYDDIEAYILHRRQLGFKGQTIIREIAALKRGLSIARRQGAIATMLTEWPPIKRDPPNPSRRGKLHSPAVISEVFKFLTQTTRDGCMFALLTGIRYQELRRVMATWVEPAPPGARVPAVLRLPAEGTKTRRERIVGLSQPALDIVQRNIGRTPLFPQVNYAKALAEACKKAKYTPVITLRDLRHTYATLATLGTGDVRATQAALGHMDLATTERYLSSTTIRTLDSSAEVAKAKKKRLWGASVGDLGHIGMHRQLQYPPTAVTIINDFNGSYASEAEGHRFNPYTAQLLSSHEGDCTEGDRSPRLLLEQLPQFDVVEHCQGN